MANSYYKLLLHNNCKVQWLKTRTAVYFAHETARCMGSVLCHCGRGCSLKTVVHTAGKLVSATDWEPSGAAAGGLSSPSNGPLHGQAGLTQRTMHHCKGECFRKTREKLRGLFHIVTTRPAVSLWPQSFGQGRHKGPPAIIDPTSQWWSHSKNIWDWRDCGCHPWKTQFVAKIILCIQHFYAYFP